MDRDLQFTFDEKENSGMQIDILRLDGSRMCRLSVYEWGAGRPYGCVDVRVSPIQTIEVQAWNDGTPVIAKTLAPEINSVSITIHGTEEAKQGELNRDTGVDSSSDATADSSV